MGFNSGKIKVQSSAVKDAKNSAFGKDVIVDPAGQHKFPGQITKIPSRHISMRGVPYPVMGVDQFGNQQLMMPGGEYQFQGNMVTEYPMNNLKNNAMNVPEGYHIMPNGQMMRNDAMGYRGGGQPYYNCGGTMPHMPHMKQGGFSSTAPQNSDIDSISGTRVNLMKNHLEENTMNAMMKQEQEQLKEQMMNYFQYGGPNEGSTYNPNMSNAGMFADAEAMAKNNLNRDFATFAGALNTSAGMERDNNARRAKRQEELGAQQKWANNMNNADSSMYSFENDPNTVPSFGDPNAQSPAWHQYMTPMSSGQTPSFQRGGDFSEWMRQLGQNWAQGKDAPDIPWGDMALSQVPGYNEFQQWAQDNPAEIQKLMATYNDPKRAFGQWMVSRDNPAPTKPTIGNNPSQAEQQKYQRDIAKYDKDVIAHDKKMETFMANQPTSNPTTTANAFEFDPFAVNPFGNAPQSAGPGTPGWYEQHRSNANIPARTKSGKRNAKAETVAGEIEGETRTITEDNKVKPNYVEKKEDASSTTGDTKVADSYNTGFDTYGGGYPMGNRKIKVRGWTIDPETGKKERFRFKNKPGRGGSGFYGAQGMPRKIKNTFNFYDGELQSAAPSPMPGAAPSKGADIERIAPIQADLSELMSPPPTIQGGYDPLAVQYGEGFSQPGTFNRTVTDVPPMSADETDAYNTRVQQAKVMQMAQQYQNDLPQQQEGGSYFPQPYPGGMQPNGSGAYFFQTGGANNPYGQLAIPEGGFAGVPELGNSAYADPQQNTQIKTKNKAVGDGSGFNQWAPMITPAIDMFSSALEDKRFKQNQGDLQARRSSLGVYSPVEQGDRGKNTVNTGDFDPFNMVPVQFGSNAQYGGEMDYRYGGGTPNNSYEAYMDDNEIAQILQMGGQIEYI